MNTDNPIKYSDLIQPDDSIAKLIKQLDDLSDSYMNVYENIRKNAIAVKASLEGVSGATEQGRKTIRAAADDSDKLTKALKERQFAESELAQKIAEVKAATHEANVIAKMQAKLANSAAGSYDALSAQYSLNKMILNQMSAEERKATQAGQELEKETLAIYEEMKRLQEATGKHQLNVGNYADATKGLRTQIMDLTQELVRLRMEGKQDSEEYQNVARQAAELKDAFRDAQYEVKNMASDTSVLDSVLSGLGAAGGGFATATGAMQLFGAESEDVQEAQRKLQASIALVNGVTAIQRNLQHQSALMLGISKIQTEALAKAEAYERLVKIKGNEATWGAVAAQKAFNLVAKANPYVLLATALITVVGALVAFSRGSKEVKVSLVEQDNAIRNLNNALKEYNMQMDFAIKKAQAEGKSTEEINQLRRQQAAEAQRTAEAVVQAEQSKLDAIDAAFENANKKQREKLQERKEDILKSLNEAYDARQKADDASRKLEDDINVQRINDAKAANESLTQMLRKAEDQRIALIANAYDRERAQRQAAAQNAIADIKKQLDQDKNLTQAQRKALNAQIVNLRQQLENDLNAIDLAQQQAETEARRKTEDILLGVMEEGYEKRRAMLDTQYTRQLEDINTQLENNKSLTETQAAELYNQYLALQEQYSKAVRDLDSQTAIDRLNTERQAIDLRLAAVKEGSEEEAQLKLEAIQKEREIELAQNRMLAEELRQDEAAINAKYDKMAEEQARQSQYDIEMARFDEMQAFEQSEIDLMKTSEAKKTAMRLKLERDRLKKILELAKAGAIQMSAVEIQTLENTIQAMEEKIQTANVPQDLYDVFGLELSDDKKNAINTSMQFAWDALNTWMQARVEAANQAVEAANKEVDAAQRAYELELQAKANGYAADVETAKKELELQKENQKKALTQQQQAQAQQEKLQTIQQLGNLVTGAAQIWGAFAATPYIAIPLIALMFASFAASKIAARNAVSEKYAEGTIELLQGGSHASGHDIDLGTKPDGTRRRAEGGEFFAVINKRSSRRYRKEIPQVIHSLNDGTFADKYLNTFNVGGVSISGADQRAVDLMPLSDDVRAIREQGAHRYIVLADGTMVEIYKNLTRRVVS